MLLIVPDQKMDAGASLMRWLKVVEICQLSTGTAGGVYLQTLRRSS